MAKKTKTKQSSPKIIKKSVKKPRAITRENTKIVKTKPLRQSRALPPLPKTSLNPRNVYEYRIQRENAIAEFKEKFRHGEVK